MKAKRFFGVFSALVLISFVITMPVFSQGDKDKKDDAKKAEDTKNIDKFEADDYRLQADNYLERFHSRETVEKLMVENLEKIYTLKIIVSNFKDKNWKPEYDKIYEDYKNGVGAFYKRELIKSRKILEDNKAAIKNLFKKVADQYRKDTQAMLDICASSILIVSLNRNTRYDQDKYMQLQNNMMRIRISYSQMDQAQSAYVDHQYQAAVFFYRAAKTYAILIMDDLLREDLVKKDDMEPEEYQKLQELASQKNKLDLPTHKADNQNRVKTDKDTKAAAKPEEKK